MPPTTDQFEPGQRIIVTQQIPQRERVWTTRAECTVVRFDQQTTGSWFAGSKDDRLWLDRLLARKDDGEQVMFVLDQYTHVRLVAEPDASGAPDDVEPQGAQDDPADIESKEETT